MTERSGNPRRVFVLGATGTIGRACVRALVRRGHEVVCFVRPRAGVGNALAPGEVGRLLDGASLRFEAHSRKRPNVSRGDNRLRQTPPEAIYPFYARA